MPWLLSQYALGLFVQRGRLLSRTSRKCVAVVSTGTPPPLLAWVYPPPQSREPSATVIPRGGGPPLPLCFSGLFPISVLQEDLLLGFLTVEESIQFSADLQLKAPAEQRRKMVDQVIRNSGLDGVRKTKVGSQVVRGVSGGEKRRVSIAVEVVGFKPLLFLDEPTSGLDSAVWPPDAL